MNDHSEADALEEEALMAQADGEAKFLAEEAEAEKKFLVQRKTWDEFFFQEAMLWATRSTCLYRQYGAALVKDKTIVATGFNGAPRGSIHCLDIGCLRDNIESGTQLEVCRAVHAEQNTIINAARLGVSTLGTELYLWPGDMPCTLCIRSLINAGVRVIHITQLEYPGWELSRDIIEGCTRRIVVRIHASEAVKAKYMTG